MHDFKITDYTEYFITKNLFLAIFIVIIFSILIFVILAFSLAYFLDVEENKYVFLILMASIGLSIFISHLIFGNFKYDVTYEAKAKVVDCKYKNDYIVDDKKENSNGENGYIIIQMNNIKQKIYLNTLGEEDNTYKAIINSNIKKGDTVKINLHADYNFMFDKPPKIGDIDYLNNLKEEDPNTNYIELKKIK